MRFAVHRFLQVFAAALVLLQPFFAHAQADVAVAAAGYGEESILFEEIPSVYGASKYEQKVTEAPSSVSIITSSEIEKYGYRTLTDILRSVRSFYVTNDRNYSYVGVRGFGRPGDYNSRILLLIDGHRTNDNVYNQAMVGTEAVIDVDLIDRVEIIRGPGSSLYGSNAFFAVVNVITKRGRDLKGAEASGEAGSFKTYKGRLSYGDRYQNGLEAIVSASGYDSKGDRLYYRDYDTPATNNGIADHTDYDKYQSFFTKASLQDFTFEGAYSSRTKGVPTGAFGTDFNDRGNKTKDEHAYVDLKYDHNLGGQTDLTARAYYDYYRYTGDYMYSGVTNKDLGDGNWWGGEVKLSSRLFDVHRVIVGAEYTDNMRQDQQNYDVSPYTLYLDDKRRSKIWASYIQDEITLSKKIMLNAGVRYDHYSTFGGTTNPRLALIVSPTEKSAVKLLYGSAFRAPNDYELYYTSPTSTPPMVANPDLKPEKINTYELVYEHYLGDHLRATAAGYYYKIKDLINQTADAMGNSVFMNIEEVEARGIELELDNKWANGMEGKISYTIQRAEDKLTGEPLTNSPAQSAKLNLAVPIMREKVFAGVEEQYMSRRRSLAGDYADGFYITNLTLFTQNIINRFELSASVYNLFGKKYGDPVSADLVQNILQQDGRTYRLKLTYAF
jgi:iron complex outermembrane receptor protein